LITRARVAAGAIGAHEAVSAGTLAAATVRVVTLGIGTVRDPAIEDAQRLHLAAARRARPTDASESAATRGIAPAAVVAVDVRVDARLAALSGAAAATRRAIAVETDGTVCANVAARSAIHWVLVEGGARTGADRLVGCADRLVSGSTTSRRHDDKR
jgi:hypothetical protein